MAPQRLSTAAAQDKNFRMHLETRTESSVGTAPSAPASFTPNALLASYKLADAANMSCFVHKQTSYEEAAPETSLTRKVSPIHPLPKAAQRSPNPTNNQKPYWKLMTKDIGTCAQASGDTYQSPQSYNLQENKQRWLGSGMAHSSLIPSPPPAQSFVQLGVCSGVC